MKKILRSEELMTIVGEMVIYNTLKKDEQEPVRKIKILILHVAREAGGQYINAPISEKEYRKKYYDIAQDLGFHDVRKILLPNYDKSDKNFSTPDSTIKGAFKNL